MAFLVGCEDQFERVDGGGGQVEEAKIHKTHLTVTVGVGARGSNAALMGENFTGPELSEAVNRLRGTA